MAEHSILGHASGDPAAALAEIHRAAAADWKAAAWLLQNAPATRGEWGDLARIREIEGKLIGRVLQAVQTTSLPLEWEQRLLLALQAHGVALSEP